MKTEKAKIRNGRLQCHVCVHWKNCSEVNTECVANFIYDNKVVHLVEKERKEEKK